MKPRYLMQNVYLWIIMTAVYGIVAVWASVLSYRNGDIKDSIIVTILVFLMLLLIVRSFRENEYCRLDEKGITFFQGNKNKWFVSWESISKTERRQFGHGRGRHIIILVYNDEYFETPASVEDIYKPNCARGFHQTFNSDSVFAEYLRYYRNDLKITEADG